MGRFPLTSFPQTSIIAVMGKTRVLLVDDNARYRSQLRRMTGKVFAQSLIHEADSMREALRVAGQHPIQLALVDMVLRHDSESGIQCTRRLRALDPQMVVDDIVAVERADSQARR